MRLKNQDIRDRVKKCGLRMYELAELIGVSDQSLSHWLRHELTDERRERIETAFNQAERAKA